MKHDRRGLKFWPSLPTVMIGLSACAAEQQVFPPPSAEVRRQLSESSLTPDLDIFISSVDNPNSGIGRGAAQGALTGAAAGASPIYLCHPPLAAVLAPVGAVVGAGVGAGVAHSEEEVMAASASLNAALAEMTPTEDLFGHLREAGSRHRVATLLQVEGVAAGRTEAPEESDPAGTEDTIKIGVETLTVDSRGEWDPDISILMSASARLVHAGDNAVLYRRSWQYRSPWRDYFDMAEDEARLLRDQIDTGLSELADAIMTDLFVATVPEIHPVEPVPVGEVWTVAAWSAAEEPARPEPAALAQAVPAMPVTPDVGGRLPPSMDLPTAGPGGTATDRDYFGAIAISTTSGFRSGDCVNQSTVDLAEACALSECGAFCETRAVFGNGQCAAIAGSDGRQRPEDVVVGQTSAAASEGALAQCRSLPRLGRYDTRCKLMARPSCNLAGPQVVIGDSAPSQPAMDDAPCEQEGATAGAASAAAAAPSSVGSAGAPILERFGAIAVSATSTFRSGSCTDQASAAQAETCAIRDCGRHCEVRAVFGAGQCAAAAGKGGVQGVRRDSPQNAWQVRSVAVGQSSNATIDAALAECRRRHQTCDLLIRPVCNP